jgi:pimeloyl-ACP methyl ester carboxylesterase
VELLLRIPNTAEGISAILHLPELPTKTLPTGLLMVHSQGGSKIGHKRAFVEIGRRLEQLGVPGLRFDLLGEGESEDLLEDPYLQWRGLKTAIDFFWNRCKLTRLVALGDCFGGMLAACYALREPRIDHTLAWNMAQMNWTEEFLEGYSGIADRKLDRARSAWGKLVRPSSWRSGSFTQEAVFNFVSAAIIAPISCTLKTATAHIRLHNPPPLQPLDDVGRPAQVTVIHSLSQPGGAQAASVAQHAFRKLGVEAEHLPVCGVPFSAQWKAIAFATVQSVVLSERALTQ